MGFKNMSLIIDIDMAAPDKSVLLALAFRANDKNLLAYPSYGRIAFDTGYSRSTVIRAVKSLINGHFIERLNSNTRSNVYKLILPTSVTETPERYHSDTSVSVTPVSERHPPSITETPVKCQRETTLVSERHPNMKEQEENKKSTSLSSHCFANDHTEALLSQSNQSHRKMNHEHHHQPHDHEESLLPAWKHAGWASCLRKFTRWNGPQLGPHWERLIEEHGANVVLAVCEKLKADDRKPQDVENAIQKNIIFHGQAMTPDCGGENLF